ncbi:M23 family metallopeptidase [Saccharopolyspora sp. SCSIO 74807]|uniref:M23 family metallopeptidase n=1 Tax=Saccharopolyspora sp. SCSIO 74807 TaxID=3118084 RepID=UPI0030D04963
MLIADRCRAWSAALGLVSPLLVLLMLPAAGVAQRTSPATTEPAPEFMRPLASAAPVLRPFEPPSSEFGPGHRGVDLAGAAGEQVRSAGAGTVRFAGVLADRPVVSIEHSGGLRTTYEPVRATVQAGQAVAPGQPIGALDPGHPGCPADACLHWGVRRGPEYRDPLGLLGGGRVRLLPWDAADQVTAVAR